MTIEIKADNLAEFNCAKAEEEVYGIRILQVKLFVYVKLGKEVACRRYYIHKLGNCKCFNDCEISYYQTLQERNDDDYMHIEKVSSVLIYY